MLTRLDRYILKELFSPFLLGMFILMFILIMQQIMRLMELVIDKGIGLLTIMELFFSLLPSFLMITIPMAVMMATVTTFNRLSADHEIIALHAVGIGFSRLFRPVLIFAVLVSMFALLMGVLSGTTKGLLKSLAVNMLMKQASVALEEGRFNDVFNNMMIYVDAMPTLSELKGVFIYDQRNPDKPVVIVAKEGVLVSNQAAKTIGLYLVDGSLHQNMKKSNRYQKMTFANYDVQIDFSEMVKKKENIDQFSYSELQQRISESKGKDVDALRLLATFYQRFLFALATFLFCMMGMPLGIISGRITRVGGFAGGVFIIVFYYMMITAGDSLINAHIISPLIGAMLPSFILAPVSVFLLKKIAHEVSPTLFGIASKRP